MRSETDEIFSISDHSGGRLLYRSHRNKRRFRSSALTPTKMVASFPTRQFLPRYIQVVAVRFRTVPGRVQVLEACLQTQPTSFDKQLTSALRHVKATPPVPWYNTIHAKALTRQKKSESKKRLQLDFCQTPLI